MASQPYFDEVAARHPSIDVIVASNLFGDILSDLAAAVAGSIGVAPSAIYGSGDAGLRPEVSRQGVGHAYPPRQYSRGGAPATCWRR